MSDKTKIEWTDATWNPITGCDKVSTGCDHCYAETMAHRFAGTAAYPDGFAVTLRPERLDQPLRWKRSRRIFVNSMSDLFHKDIPDEYIAQMFAVMALAPQHTFQVLTKRHARMRSLLNRYDFRAEVYRVVWEKRPDAASVSWPLPNVWLGVSVENQQWADLRIPALLDTPAAVRFLSCEPLLGQVDLRDFGIDWVIVGGESGPGARPMHPAWARTLRDQCLGAEIPFHFKQWGEWVPTPVFPRRPYSDNHCVIHPAGMTALTKTNPFDPFAAGHPNWATPMRRIGKKRAGRELDGRTHDGYPEVAA